MSNLDLRLISILQTLDCQLCFGRPLTLAGISSLRDDESGVLDALKMLAKGELEETNHGQLYQHSLPDVPKPGVFPVRLDPPRHVRMWSAPLELTFHYVKWRHGDEGYLAFVPALDIEIIAPSAEKLNAALPDHARFALGRLNALESIEKLVPLQRVGKTAVLSESVRRAAQLERIAREGGDKNEEEGGKPRGKRYWLTQAGRVIAGMKYLGMWQERCEAIIQQLAECNGVLCFESLLDVVRLGGHDPGESIAAFLAPYMQRSEVRIVAECTPSELDACRRLMPAFVDLFQILAISAFDRATALKVLEGVAGSLQQNYRITADRQVLEQTHRLFSRFRPYDAFPGHAVAFLKELFQQARRRNLNQVTIEDVISAFLRKSGLPELFLRDELAIRHADVIGYFQQHVIGQEAPCEAAAGLVLTFKAGLNDPKRPLGVFLFCGPTGVGKTELARAMAKYFFGHGEDAEGRLVRLDMSEYSGCDAAARLIAGPGGGPSEFIQQIRRQPFAVVLLDEIEKASPDVFDALMGMFDEGRLTDPYGRVTRFNSAVIVLTSNLGADKHEAAGFQMQRAISYQQEAFTFFRPEFFNRIDAVVSFRPLQTETIRQITEKELQAIAGREGFKAAGLRLEWTPEVVARLAELGFDRRYGARPLQRALERAVIAPLSRYLIERPSLRDVVLKLDVQKEGNVHDIAFFSVDFDVRGGCA